MTQPMDPNHEQKRTALRSLGLVLCIVGGLFAIIGFGSFFMSFGSFGPPRYFWCAFIGLPLLGIGTSLMKFGYMGSVARYMAEESAPVAKDTVNYLANGTQKSVQSLATAIGAGLAAGHVKPGVSAGVRCLKCNEFNQMNAKFCDQCGFALQKTKTCSSCQELNDPDAKFCDHCGGAFRP